MACIQELKKKDTPSKFNGIDKVNADPSEIMADDKSICQNGIKYIPSYSKKSTL
jgi:hypothetical protein